jgi:hypothetical protein
VEFQVNTRGSGHASVNLVGAINEEADAKLRLLAEELKQFNRLEFIFERVSGINSLGVRAWVNFLRAIRGNGREVVFSKCIPDIISQINMIPSFADGAKIDSFFVNYVCPTCEGGFSQLVQRNSLAPGMLPDEVKCPHCDAATMETEELEDEYFAFLLRDAS